MRISFHANLLDGMNETIEEYIRGDQHHSNILIQIQQEDLKAEKGMYGRVI